MAAFTTCWARLKLYDALALLGDRVLYFDKDSVIFVQRPFQQILPLGNFLGDFTSELAPQEHIVEFCSAGPKNYGYKTNTGHTVCKVKGFHLNPEGHAQLNYEVMRQNILDEIFDPVDDDKPRQIPIRISDSIQRDAKN